MCTVVILRRPDNAWPVIIGANRDEMLDRPWTPPGRHWPDRADVIAGRDDLAGGTWMGLNDAGLVACILNRRGSLGPAPGKRSRGELVLEALDHADAAPAAEALANINPAAYRPFNMIVADNTEAWWLSRTAESENSGQGIRTSPIPDGLSIFTAHDRNDTSDVRIATYLPRFEAAAPPDPDASDWANWQKLLGASESEGEVYNAMSFRMDSGFGTSSSSLMALPSIDNSHGTSAKWPIWLFAAGPPESSNFVPVDI
jgi:hypothetical protein